MVYDHGKIKNYRPDSLVLETHPRSPLNTMGRKLYDVEYGSHMKNDLNAAAGTGSEPNLLTTSAFGSFFNMVNQKKRLRMKKGISEEEFIRERMLRRTNLAVRDNYPESNVRSVAIILDGTCKVKLRCDGFECFELRQGNHFGASDLLQIPDIEFFGDIVAGPKGVKILVVERPDQIV